MFYKHVENDMVKYIVLPKPIDLLNSMLERNKK